MEANRIFTTFAGVALATETIHCDGECLVSIGTNRTEAHGTGTKPFDDLFCALNLLDWNRRSKLAFLEFEKTAKRISHLGVFVDVIGEATISVLVTLTSSNLNVRNRSRIPAMAFAFGSPMELAQVR